MTNISFDAKKYVDEKMPMLGLGTYQIRLEEEIFNSLDAALEAGYRFIDTAQVYKNEEFIGKALRKLLPKYNLKREDIFITSKLSTSNQGSDCGKSIDQSLANLQMGNNEEYLDLLLIHWPGVAKHDFDDQKNKAIRYQSYEVMENYFSKYIFLNLISSIESGKLKSIGVSNYNINHLEDLLLKCSVSPAVNQCECHPHYPNSELIEFCKKKNIHFQAYSSFGSESNKDNLLTDLKIIEMAKKYNCSVTNFLLGWALNQGLSVLPRSRNLQHVKDNFTAISLKIAPEDIEKIKSKKLKKYCWNPDKIC